MMFHVLNNTVAAKKVNDRLSSLMSVFFSFSKKVYWYTDKKHQQSNKMSFFKSIKVRDAFAACIGEQKKQKKHLLFLLSMPNKSWI